MVKITLSVWRFISHLSGKEKGVIFGMAQYTFQYNSGGPDDFCIIYKLHILDSLWYIHSVFKTYCVWENYHAFSSCFTNYIEIVPLYLIIRHLFFFQT